MHNFTFVFFGTSNFSVEVLNALKLNGLIPLAVVTFKDKPKGRKLEPQPNVVKSWALENNVQVIEDQSLAPLADVYIVASYGKILPNSIIYKPKYKTLNVHPSLLPKLRGPAPIQDAILNEETTGVTIMRLNGKMDEGPILAQKEVRISEWPVRYSIAEKILASEGGNLLSEILPKWINGEVKEIEQNSTIATYTKMIKKEDAEISEDHPARALRKIYAYEVWPRARVKDVIVTDAHIENDKLVIDKVIPPGKKEMDYADFLKAHSPIF